jgi:hypothetical protein
VPMQIHPLLEQIDAGVLLGKSSGSGSLGVRVIAVICRSGRLA